jgi:hypothetical protein
MNKKTILAIVGALALACSLGMYVIGGNNSNLTELKDFWWAPLPIALICFILAGMSKTKA